MSAKVALIMGSKSDWDTMRPATEIMSELGVEHHVEVVSAHRTPDKLMSFAETAVDNGYSVIIAGAGGAAHLPGMVASKTRLPVLGVPVQSRALPLRTSASLPSPGSSFTSPPTSSFATMTSSRRDVVSSRKIAMAVVQ